MSDEFNLLSGMPDIDYSQLSQYIQDTGRYRMQESIEKLDVKPKYLEAIQEHNERVEEERQANIRTAEHTAAMNEHLDVIVKNQGQLIKSQNKIILNQEKQVEQLEQQLRKLESIFVSNEDAALVQKEIMKMVGDKGHPIWSYIADKGGDAFVGNLPVIMPIVWEGIKYYLLRMGL